MSLDGAYDEANVFAKILRGEMGAVKVYEDAQALAFMDVFPQSKGHVLVVSKFSKARNLLDAEPETLDALIALCQHIARAQRAALKPDGIVLNQYSGRAAGQTVFHLHFHLIPRWEDVPLGRHGGGMADFAELAEQAKAIAGAM